MSHFQVAEHESTWAPLVTALSRTIREAKVAWTVNTHSARWDFGPYVQVCYFPEDNEFLAEITSNRFLDPAMPEFDEHRMRFLGWNPPVDSDYPNWYRIFPMTEAAFNEAANLWVRTLLECYGLMPEWRFQISPMDMNLFRQWHDVLVNFYGVGSYRLVDAKGRTKAELDRIEANQKSFDANMHEIHGEIRYILTRAEKLGLYGAELITLASSMASAEVEAEMRRIIYCGVDETFYYFTSDRLEALGIFGTSEIERAQAVFDEPQLSHPQLSLVAN